eukprot:211618-Prorocentrum_minimum.AAC.1
MTTSHSTRERVAPAVRHRWRTRHAPRRCAAIRRPPPTKPHPAIGHRIIKRLCRARTHLQGGAALPARHVPDAH